MPTIVAFSKKISKKKFKKKDLKKMRKAGKKWTPPVLQSYSNPNAKEGVVYCNWCAFSEEDGDVIEHEKNNHYEENVIQHWQEYGHIFKSDTCQNYHP